MNVNKMERKVLCTFENGGQLILAHESQIKFLRNLKLSDISKAIELKLLTHSVNEYYEVAQKVFRSKRYNTGREADMLNELRRCFIPLKPKRIRL